MAVELNFSPKKKLLWVDQPESVSSLVRGYYGEMKKGIIYLELEEALYLIDIRNGKCTDESLNEYKFNDVAEHFTEPKLMARYHTYKDWRDRGLVLKPLPAKMEEDYGRSPVKKYPGKDFKPPKYAVQGMFFPEDLMTVIDDEKVGRELYEDYWLGQFGTYKAEQRGRLNKLDAYETLFMMQHCGLGLRNSTTSKMKKEAKKRRPDFTSLYDVYEDWRQLGYVLKTGFKFGTHFRLYFPGASPTNEGKDWVHSKHVIQVFPRKTRLLISEWARAIRVAHSVRKTFILAIPGKETKRSKVKLDFLLYHRKKGGIENPKEDKPHFLMWSLSEEEYIGGAELADALKQAKESGLDLILAIADRETSVTYYRVKRIMLPGSKYEYYEIEWEQP